MQREIVFIKKIKLRGDQDEGIDYKLWKFFA